MPHWEGESGFKLEEDQSNLSQNTLDLQTLNSIIKTSSAIDACKKKRFDALAGVAHWLEHQAMHKRVEGSVPGQGHIHGLQV